MLPVTSIAKLPFLDGGGEMGHLTRTHNWAQTSLGTPDTWPQSLRTTLSLLLNSRFPMFLFWGEDLLCFYNDAYRPSLGNDGKHPYALGRPAPEVWPEIGETLVKPYTDRVLWGAEATWDEDRLLPIYRNGKIEDVYWTFSYSPVKNESGQIAGVFVTCTETTCRVANLKKLADSKNQLHFAIEAAELGTWDYSPATDTFTGNERLKEWFGLPPKEEIELSMAIAVIAEKDRKRVSESIRKTLDVSSGGQYDIEYTIVHPETQKERIVRARGRAWFDEGGTAYRFNGTLQDVTEQAIIHRKVEAEKQRFRTLLEAMPNMAWTSTPMGKVTYYNQTCYDYTGNGFEELQDGRGVLHPDDLKPVSEGLRVGLVRRQVFMMECRLRRYDGTYHWHLARAVPIWNEHGNITSWVGTMTDIHEQKQLEAELDQKVQLRTQQLQESIQDLKRSNENLQQFAYIASHDLQEPLRKIQSFGDLIKSQYGDRLGDGSDYLQRMQTAARRMSVLIEDLLTYSRISTRQEKSTDVLLTKLVSDVLNNLEYSIEEAGAVVKLEPLPTVRGDISQLTQLFQNLLSNALKFRRSDVPPLITIRAVKVSRSRTPSSYPSNA